VNFVGTSEENIHESIKDIIKYIIYITYFYKLSVLQETEYFNLGIPNIVAEFVLSKFILLIYKEQCNERDKIIAISIFYQL